MNTSIVETIGQAFWAARESGKPDWWRMTTAVLKNRLLMLTDRQFKEQDYGARSVLEFAASFPEVISLDTTTYPPEVELRTVKIRSDLWRAAIDCSTGAVYVWDSEQQKARVRATSNDNATVIPTLTEEEMAVWRREFIDRQRWQWLSGAESAEVERWVQSGRITRAMPEPVKTAWNRERSWRVWAHLSRWFAGRFALEEIPAILELPEVAKRGIRARLLRVIGSSQVSAPTDPDIDALNRCRDAGDWLGFGEVLSAKFPRAIPDELDGLFARVVAAWAMPVQPLSVGSIDELIRHVGELVPAQAATALINASYRIRKSGGELPGGAGDLAFRLTDAIESIYGVGKQRSPTMLCLAGVANLAGAYEQLLAASHAFLKTSAVTAKAVSIDLLRNAHQYRAFALAGELGHLRELDIILGAEFRKFCESCERHAAQDAVRRASELRAQMERLSAGVSDTRAYSTLWTTVVQPAISHVANLLEEGTRQSEEANRPALAVEKSSLKLDLVTCERPTSVSCRLINSGPGRAERTDLVVNGAGVPAEVDLVEPQRPFDVPATSSQVLTFLVVVHERRDVLHVPITWVCSDSSGKRLEFSDQLDFEQQRNQPDWDALLLKPPYTISPVRERDRLFGRDAILKRLFLHATSATSTFLWGQKRVGKTSVLQVLASELDGSGTINCIFLRMGELIALHEGQIAHTIATRLNEKCRVPIAVPDEEYFGAGLSRLIPLVEQLSTRNGERFVVIIDEFDDLDTAFYTGERGRQFVKALRSLSEVGLTFFFVGSERMDTIYTRHAVELNKWVNLHLDRIEVFTDCKELIAEPVSGSLEYEDAAIAFVAEYCGGNPFYMHLFCFETFKRCVEEHRTFISHTDAQVIRQYLVRTLGRTNFAHLWEDNPELGQKELAAQSAENCLALAAIASLGGRFEDIEDVLDAQDSLGLSEVELITTNSLRQTIERLKRRRVLTINPRDNRTEVALPIFREWLAENSDQVVATWREFVRRKELDQSGTLASRAMPLDSGAAHFPIPEDDLLAVSQRLVYCGRQKDVAEVRQWLRQFDDDSRIEVAFSLLRRLAEHGYMSEGARSRMLTVAEEALQNRRTATGGQVWKIVRGRKDNLCITYVDSETKSGGATAREFAKRVRPGKVADGQNIEAWLRTHRSDDPLVMIVDDFAGTGSTLEGGLERLLGGLPGTLLAQYVDDRRISCFCLFAFPEALERLRARFPDIEFLAAHVFGDEVRALEVDAKLFESDDERVYARDILLQIGRELTAQMPLGWGDMGALVAFHNTIPNNTLPVFWCEGRVNDRNWLPLFPRA